MHRAIYRAIRDRNPEAARDSMRDHLMKAQKAQEEEEDTNHKPHIRTAQLTTKGTEDTKAQTRLIEQEGLTHEFKRCPSMSTSYFVPFVSSVPLVVNRFALPAQSAQLARALSNHTAVTLAYRCTSTSSPHTQRTRTGFDEIRRRLQRHATGRNQLDLRQRRFQRLDVTRASDRAQPEKPSRNQRPPTRPGPLPSASSANRASRRRPYRRQTSIVSRFNAGLTTKRAPARMHARAVSQSSTVPAPTVASEP
jgi:hypothetical protein